MADIVSGAKDVVGKIGQIGKGVGELLIGRDPDPSEYLPQMYQVDPWAFRYGQGGNVLGAALGRRMLGSGARGTLSPAEEQMKTALGANIRGAMAARTARPGMPAAVAGGGAGVGMGRTIATAGTARGREQAAAAQAMQNYLGQQMQGRMAEQQLGVQQQQAYNQMMLQQAMANAGLMEKQGLLGSLLQAGGGGLAAGMMAGGGGSGQMSPLQQGAVNYWQQQYDPFG